MKWLIIFLCGICLILFNSAFFAMENKPIFFMLILNFIFLSVIITRFEQCLKPTVLLSLLITLCGFLAYGFGVIGLKVLNSGEYSIQNCSGRDWPLCVHINWMYDNLGVWGPIIVYIGIALLSFVVLVWLILKLYKITSKKISV